MMDVDIAVIGGGLSAAATIVSLVDQLRPEASVALVGDAGSLGRGIAYSTRDQAHRLNVPAARMSLYADRPDHLTDWLAAGGLPYGPEDFIPRALYGRYVQDTLADGLYRTDNRARIHLIDTQALDCEALGDDRQVFHLGNGDRLAAKKSVLCLGGTPAGLPLPESRIAPEARRHLIVNVWVEDWINRVAQDDAVFLLGSGLTMIDQALSLKHRGHRGQIHVVSRHGLTPLPHRSPRSHPVAPVLTPGSQPLSGMMRTLRDAAEAAEDWRAVVDGVRPVTQQLWQALSLEERRRFLRHANAWWNIHRHRIAADMAAEFEEMRRSGQVIIKAGWLSEIYAGGHRARVAFKDRHTGTIRQISVDWLANCTGMEKCSISKAPLLKKMSARGMIRGDALGLGVAVDPESRLLREDASVAASTYAMGPMTTGQYFEIFAAPDIRVQAARVASRIAGELGATASPRP